MIWKALYTVKYKKVKGIIVYVECYYVSVKRKKNKLMDKGTYTYRGLQHALENIWRVKKKLITLALLPPFNKGLVTTVRWEWKKFSLCIPLDFYNFMNVLPIFFK